MEKIQKVSSYLLIVFNILMAYFLLPPFIQWGLMGSWLGRFFLEHVPPIETPEGLISLTQVHWTPLAKSVAFGADLISVAPILVGLFILKSIFANYKRGAIFTVANARHYRSLGAIFFMDALLIQPFATMLQILSISLSNPPGHRWISLNFGTPNLEVLIYGLLALVISWVMLEASKIQEDQKLTI